MPQESTSAQDSTDRPQLPQSSLTAGQLLNRMIDMIAIRRRIGDFDIDTVLAALVPTGGDDHGGALRYVARLTQEWRYVLQFEPAEPIGPMLQLEFFDSDGGANAPMTEIAQVDLDRFSTELRAAGFAEQEIPGERGESLGLDFTAGELRVTVASIGEADSPADKVAHRCIRSVTVR